MQGAKGGGEKLQKSSYKVWVPMALINLALYNREELTRAKGESVDDKDSLAPAVDDKTTIVAL